MNEEYLNETPDGSVDITLKRPIDIDGASVMVLRMREPLVDDQLIMEATKGSDAIKEMNFVANLCGVTLADVKKLTTRDYGRVQKAFGFFKD